MSKPEEWVTASANGPGAAEFIGELMDNFPSRPLRSTAAFRNAILDTSIILVNPMIGGIGEVELNNLRRLLRVAVSEGRLIDFGFIPNEVIMATSKASREAFEAGAFEQPFEDWIGVMPWEGGFNAYYIMAPQEQDDTNIVVEIYGTEWNGKAVVMIYDVITIRRTEEGVRLSPAPWQDGLGLLDTEESVERRCANSLDPLVTMLRLLAEASVPIERVEHVKLNQKRARIGKPPIPPHTTVVTKDYVTGFAHSKARGGRTEAQGGTHASPVAHWRRAHQRHLPDRVIHVRSTRVNWRDATELRRLFYRVKQTD